MESMTGFGASERGNLRIEIRSLNHRFLEINFKMSHWFYPSELKMRELVKSRFSRGKIDINLSFIEPPQNVILNRELLQKLLEELKGLPFPQVTMPFVINLRDLMIERPYSYNEEELLKCLDEALSSLKRTRKKEGEALKAELLKRIENIAIISAKIKTLEPEAFQENMRRWKERALAMIKEIEAEGNREGFQEGLLKALASLLEKSDITEEFVRVDSHIRQFKDAVGSSETTSGPVGKRLDFIIQEIFREFNTMGAKSLNAEIRGLVVEAKAGLEKIREQVQNIE